MFNDMSADVVHNKSEHNQYAQLATEIAKIKAQCSVNSNLLETNLKWFKCTYTQTITRGMKQNEEVKTPVLHIGLLQ